MATVEVRCPHCDSSYRVSGDAVGKSGRCKKCGESFRLKVASDTSKSAAPETNAGHNDSTGTGRRLPEKVARFQIQRQLGEGGFGTVYLAFDPILERQVALKVPHPHLLRKTEDRQRYLREAKTAARLRHAHIVPLLEATVEGDDLYIAAAYIEGQPLDSLLRDRRASLDESVSWVIKLARALDYAHKQGVIHRDVKSGNIILDEHGEPLLMDFGLARIIASDEQLTQTDSVMGTPAYMSPEQAAGRTHEISPATDQYSLGVLLYELISGKRPFTGPVGMVISLVINTPPPAPSEHDPSIPVELETLCMRMMSKQIGERYPSLGEAARELERFLKRDRSAAVDSSVGGTIVVPATPGTEQASGKRVLGVADSLRPSRVSANTKNFSKPLRSTDRGSSRQSWRPVAVFGGLGKRSLIASAGVAAFLVALLVPHVINEAVLSPEVI